MDAEEQEGNLAALGVHVSTITGPFFLGFMLQSFGLGIVLILSINYFANVWQRCQQPEESASKLGVSLVLLSLAAHVGQWAVDLTRGWKMFVSSFLDLQSFLTPTSIFFFSPLLGQIPVLITQLFLLRRASLFLTSMGALWPRLAYSSAYKIFCCCVATLAILSSVASVVAGVAAWKCGGLWRLLKHVVKLGLDSNVESIIFAVASMIYLSMSAAVDVLISLVLCIELSWARQKLATPGGRMHQIVTRLILVTLHGGSAVTALQLASLLMYNLHGRSACSYLPVLFLPKVYTVTLILSLSLPPTYSAAPGPSYIYSLPTITVDSVRPGSVSRLETRRASCPPAPVRESSPQGAMKSRSLRQGNGPDSTDKGRKDRHDHQLVFEANGSKAGSSGRAPQQLDGHSCNGPTDKASGVGLSDFEEVKGRKRAAPNSNVETCRPLVTGSEDTMRRPSERNSRPCTPEPNVSLNVDKILPAPPPEALAAFHHFSSPHYCTVLPTCRVDERDMSGELGPSQDDADRFTGRSASEYTAGAVAMESGPPVERPERAVSSAQRSTAIRPRDLAPPRLDPECGGVVGVAVGCSNQQDVG